MKKILERGQQKAYEILERAEVRRKAMVDSYLKQREKGQQKAYEILERAEVRSKSVVDSFLKQREKLKKLQLELTVAGFGLSLLGWFEAYQSSVSFGRVEFGVVDTRRSVDDMHSNVGGLKSTISTSFDQFQTVSDEFRWKMAELEASVAMAEVNRETEYRGILSLAVMSDVRYNRPDTILKKKFGFHD